LNIGREENFEMSRRRYEDNIEISLKRTELEGADWIHLAQDRGPMVGPNDDGNESSGSI
jgi:hypothetical protein